MIMIAFIHSEMSRTFLGLVTRGSLDQYCDTFLPSMLNMLFFRPGCARDLVLVLTYLAFCHVVYFFLDNSREGKHGSLSYSDLVRS